MKTLLKNLRKNIFEMVFSVIFGYTMVIKCPMFLEREFSQHYHKFFHKLRKCSLVVNLCSKTRFFSQLDR